MSSAIVDALYCGTYESSELKPLRLFLEPQDTVFEIGAGIGFISLYCAKLIGSDRVFSYEANPNNEVHIRENYTLNGLYPQLSICFLGEKAGGVEDFYIADDFWASSAISPAKESKRIQVECRSLNGELRRVSPSVLVLDVEGAEKDILRLMDLTPIRKVAVEFHPEFIGEAGVQECVDRLVACGFHRKWETTSGKHQYFCRGADR